MSSIAVAISPASLSLGANPCEKDVERLVELLLSVSDLGTCGPVAFLTHSETYAALVETHRLPLGAGLRTALKDLAIPEYSPVDIENLYYSAMHVFGQLESEYSIEGLLAEQLTDAPNCSADGTDAFSRAQREFWNVVATVVQHDPSRAPLVIEVGERTATFEFKIHEVETGLTPSTYCPCVFTLSCPTFATPDAALVFEDRHLTLLESADAEILRIVINLANAQYRRELSSATTSESDWSLGSGFFESLDRNHLFAQSAILAQTIRSALEAINRTNLAHTHALRTGAGGGAGALSQGGFAAMRHDIDREWHLHYWVGPKNAVELSAVVKHNDFGIPRCEIQEAS